ncbi:MAG: malonyl-ACP O-methyltransferase BioC [bacterium]
MQPFINKNLIKTRFKKSLDTYNRHATVQTGMAAKLIEILAKNCGNKFETILEIGCGTGILTEKILKNINFSEFYTNDIVEDSEKYIQKISKNIVFLGGDAEIMNFSLKADLIISNATFQWFSDLPAFLKKISLNLNKGGILAFTSFGHKNLYEISKITNYKLSYLDKNIFNDCFELVYYDSEIIELIFDNPVKILEHLKYSGTNALSNQSWSRRNFNDFILKYKELFSFSQGVHLTYQPVYFIFKN